MQRVERIVVSVVIVALLALVIWLAADRSRSEPRRRSKCRDKQKSACARCPENVFDVTSTTLWPCQAQADMAAAGLNPKSLAKCIPAVFPWDPSYNTLRLNVDLQQQRQPLFIVQPRCAQDVVRTIRYAQRHGQLVSIRSGGHCNEPYSIFNPIVIAISSLNGPISFNSKTGVITCSGGATQGNLFQAISEINRRESKRGSGKSWAFALSRRHHGGVDLGSTTGNASDVGLTGILSAGGVGFLQRQLGLTIDSVVSLTLALADGRLVKATADNEFADLWVAARGSGGGNYGVITKVELQLHQLGGLITFTISWTDWTQAAAVFQVWQTLAPNFPNNLTQQLYFVIKDGATTPAVSSAGVFIGTDLSALQLLLQPFLAIPTATATYQQSDFESQARQFASGRTYLPFGYRRTQFAFAPLSMTAVLTLIAEFESALGIRGVHTIEFDPFGGQVLEFATNSSGFFARGAQFWLLFVSVWQDQVDEAANLAWLQTIFDAMLPFSSPFCYTGFMIANLPNFLNSYYGTNLPMLQATKRKYDPNNFFSFPQSIPPL
jgi:FAD/FMN-containing dehydrogenase